MYSKTTVLDGARDALKQTIERIKREGALKVDSDGVVTDAFGNLISPNEFESAFRSARANDVVDALKKEASYYEKANKQDSFDVAKKLQIKSYHGQWYDFEERPLNTLEMVELVRKESGETFELSKINQVIETANILKAIDHIPNFYFPKVKKMVDNDFRFNKTAYGLLHYFLFEKKQKYIFFLMSEGGKGKSTFTNFLKQLFKNEYFSADVKFANQFFAGFCASKRLVCFSDCTSNYIENMHLLKQISGGDDVSIERKGENAYSGQINANLLFVGNEPLSYDILDSGNQKRFVNLPWENNIESPNPAWLDHKWTDEEIAFQIELARQTTPIDFEYYRSETIKESVKYRDAICFTKYSEYKDFHKNSRCYSLQSFKEFWKLTLEYYTFSEIEKIKKELWNTDFDAKTLKSSDLLVPVSDDDLPF